jgi:hypothetical protein
VILDSDVLIEILRRNLQTSRRVAARGSAGEEEGIAALFAG